VKVGGRGTCSTGEGPPLALVPWCLIRLYLYFVLRIERERERERERESAREEMWVLRHEASAVKRSTMTWDSASLWRKIVVVTGVCIHTCMHEICYIKCTHAHTETDTDKDILCV
jgi:hypothetical protein